MNAFIRRSLPKWVFGLLLASGFAAGTLAASAQPAQAGVVVSIGFGNVGYGYAPAPAYHWHRWHDGYGWHRRYVPVGWAPPPAFYPPAYAVPVVYGRPYPRPYAYARPVPYYPVSHYGYGWSHDRYGSARYAAWHGDGRYGYQH
jgi:hypothetical protein